MSRRSTASTSRDVRDAVIDCAAVTLASQSSALDDARGAGSAALAKVPEELDLEPVEGLPRLVGRRLHRLLFRAISMIEQPNETFAEPITPTRGWFRRDRHRHPVVDPNTYRLTVNGVARPRTFSLDELRALPWTERITVMECAGNGNHWMGTCGLVAQGRFRGPSLATILEACGGPGTSTHFAFHGLDPMRPLRPGYHYGLSLEELLGAGAIVALELNGEPLPRPRGFPARLVVPGIYSMSHVKWLGRIEGLDRPHRGFWNRHVFVNKRRRGRRWVKEEARWIGLKSAITRCLRDQDGWMLHGFAWGGGAPVAQVEVTFDGGTTWHRAEVLGPTDYLDDPPDDPEALRYAWSVFRIPWRPERPGRYRLGSRATAADGRVQPLERDPDLRGHFDVVHVKWRDVTVP